MLILSILGWQDHYVVHNFVNMALNYGGLPLSPNDQVLHVYQIIPSTHDPSLSLTGWCGLVFNWHYIQCVQKILYLCLSSNRQHLLLLLAVPYRR